MNKTLALNPPFLWPLALRIFWLLSILSIVALLIFYVFQVNAVVSERYLIQKQENRLIELSGENKNLEINSAQVISLDNILTLLEDSDFEKTSKVHYIQILGNTVVAR